MYQVKTVTVSTKLTEATQKKIKRIADKKGMKVSDLLRKLIMKETGELPEEN